MTTETLMTGPAFANLPGFARWFLAQPLAALRPPASAVIELRMTGGLAHGVVLCRLPPYQVELFSIAGAGSFPEHAHPNVDSIEVILSGDIGFTIEGRRMVTEEHLSKLCPDGALAICGKLLRVRPKQRHGGIIGSRGAAFLSIQRWLNGVPPTSVGLDWDGSPHLGVAHHA